MSSLLGMEVCLLSFKLAQCLASSKNSMTVRLLAKYSQETVHWQVDIHFWRYTSGDQKKGLGWTKEWIRLPREAVREQRRIKQGLRDSPSLRNWAWKRLRRNCWKNKREARIEGWHRRQERKES